MSLVPDEQYYLQFREHNFGFSHEIYVPKSLQELRHKEGIALDIGCNSCELAAFLDKKIRYIGVDMSGVALKVAVDKDRIMCDSRYLPFRDSTFDMIFAYEVLEHLEDYDKILSEARRVIKDSGEFVVSVPNRMSLARISLRTPEHVTWFTPRMLDRALEKFNFIPRRIGNATWLPILKVKFSFIPLVFHNFNIRISTIKRADSKE